MNLKERERERERESVHSFNTDTELRNYVCVHVYKKIGFKKAH